MATNTPKLTSFNKPKRKGLTREHRESIAFYGFIAPWIMGFICLSIIPLTFGLLISFSNFDGLDLSGASFIGTSNYVEALTSPTSWSSLRLTFLFTFLSVPIGLITALGLAILLNLNIPGRGFFRTIFYLPTMVPGVATAMVFQTILNTNSGFVNMFISLFKRGTVINWVGDYGIGCLIFMGLWHCGTGMIIFLAGLQGVPEELEEAAMIDGANKWQSFWNVTWPILSPITFFQTMMGFIGALQMWSQASILSQANGGNFWTPLQSMFVYPAYALSQMMSYQRFGYGAALLWVLFVVIMIIALIFQKTSKYWVFYSVEQGKEMKGE